jgi:hypothetical protein
VTTPDEPVAIVLAARSQGKSGTAPAQGVVAKPERSGFGSKLIESGIGQIGGTATIAFRSSRAVCVLECPLC